MPAISPRAFDMEAYIKVGLQLIPLQKWDAKDKRGRERGKTPRDGAWQARDYDSRGVLESVTSKGINAGVRLPATVVVLDVDPRNFENGVDSLAKLVKACDLDLTVAPHVITGSGGHHYYFKKPEDLVLMDSHVDYPGLEFKSFGRQVVAAGSLHPCGKHYEWDDFAPPLDEMPDMPANLLSLVKRPTRAHGDAAGLGELTPDMLSATLEQLDPDDFKGQEWQDLMMACHHATDGEGRQEFIEWSTQAAGYEDHAYLIGRRWDSLHASTGRGNRPVTIKYLHKVVQEAGGEVARSEPEDDFEIWEDEEELGRGVDTEKLVADPTPESGPDAILEMLNAKHCAVMAQGDFRIFTESWDPILERKMWYQSTPTSFLNFYNNRKLQVPNSDKTVPYGKFWLEHPKRRQYEGIVFDPTRDHPGMLNLWQGWGVEAKEGAKWDLLAELIHDVLASGVTEYSEYILDWLAYMIQYPNRPAEVALCFQGEKGVGKSTLGNVMCRLTGLHGIAVSNPRHVQGNFNAHLRSCLCLFADEAFTKSGDDSAQAATLKQLITEPALFYEAKGENGVMDKNRLHIIMASNSDWMVPTSLDDERRFAVFKVSNCRQGDHDFFGKLHEQLEEGGYEAFLYYLMHRPLGKWAPRKNIPQTDALIGQKKASMDHLQNWWYDKLQEEDIEPLTEGEDWEKGPIRVLAQDFYDSYLAYFTRHKRSGEGPLSKPMFEKKFGRLVKNEGFKKLRPTISDKQMTDMGLSSNRPYAYELPSLKDCKDAFGMSLMD
ncbi:P4-specific DNA primase [Pseudomonas phage ZQG1]|nr:P4-specific DNA primase [Pseudomonas phage ZQG1]